MRVKWAVEMPVGIGMQILFLYGAPLMSGYVTRQLKVVIYCTPRKEFFNPFGL
jgi:hypothetical protein